MKKIPAQWKKTKDGIEISYLKQRDQFKLEKNCAKWEEYPCFKFAKSISGKESLLKFELPYINWEWKHPEDVAAKKPKMPDRDKCKIDCEKMKKLIKLKKLF